LIYVYFRLSCCGKLFKDPDVPVNRKITAKGKRVFIESNAPGGLYDRCPAFLKLAESWTDILGRAVNIRLRIDLTPVKDLPAAEKEGLGPIEIIRLRPEGKENG